MSPCVATVCVSYDSIHGLAPVTNQGQGIEQLLFIRDTLTSHRFGTIGASEIRLLPVVSRDAVHVTARWNHGCFERRQRPSGSRKRRTRQTLVERPLDRAAPAEVQSRPMVMPTPKQDAGPPDEAERPDTESIWLHTNQHNFTNLAHRYLFYQLACPPRCVEKSSKDEGLNGLCSTAQFTNGERSRSNHRP
jgi:hypothetical protein